MRPNKLIVSDRPRTFRRVLATIPLLLFVTLAPTSAWSQTPPPLAPRDMAMTMPGTFTFVSVGDLIIRTPISQLADQHVQAALRFIREGDMAFGNLEGSLADFQSYRGTLSGFVGSAEAARDVKAMGFDMVNRANNHLFDNEAEGMFETNRLLDEAGIVHAGSGRNLDEAAAPAFLETPKGRVGLVGMHTPNWQSHLNLGATNRTGNLGGKSGLNMLHYSEEIVLTRRQIEALSQIQGELLEYRDRYDNPRSVRDLGPDRVNFIASSSGREDPTYRVAREGEIPGTIDYTLNRSDLQRVDPYKGELSQSPSMNTPAELAKHPMVQRFGGPKGIMTKFRAGSIQNRTTLQALKAWHDGQLKIAESQIQEAVRIGQAQASVDANRFLERLNREYLSYLGELGLKNVNERQDMIVRLSEQTSQNLSQIMNADWPVNAG